MNYNDAHSLAEWFGCTTADIQKMVAKSDWCMWRRLEEKVMEDAKLEARYHQAIHKSGKYFPQADLPTRIDSLISAYQSLHP